MYKKPYYTIGKLFINDEYFCDTLEDCDRGLDDSMSIGQIQSIKIYSETAIPSGTYEIDITYSNKFKRDLPLIKNVKGFEGVRIHRGNTKEHTSGCILVGENKERSKVINSTKYEIELIKLLKEVKDREKINIEITD